MGASSISPSPITTLPEILTVSNIFRIASTARPSVPFLSPRPTLRAAAIAAASVTRTNSNESSRFTLFPPFCCFTLLPMRSPAPRNRRAHPLASRFSVFSFLYYYPIFKMNVQGKKRPQQNQRHTRKQTVAENASYQKDQ